MNNEELHAFISYMGKEHVSLVTNGLIPDEPLSEVFPGSNTIYFEPAPGVSMTFSPDGKVFEKLFLILKKNVPSDPEYQGELPPQVYSVMSQQQVREAFGTPAESHGPPSPPILARQCGGWDIYPYNGQRFPGIDLVFSYNAEMQVTHLVFKRHI